MERFLETEEELSPCISEGGLTPLRAVPLQEVLLSSGHLPAEVRYSARAWFVTFAVVPRQLIMHPLCPTGSHPNWVSHPHLPAVPH